MSDAIVFDPVAKSGAVTLAKQYVPTLVSIGGKTEKFVPNINASKWDDECWLNINHKDTAVGVETATVEKDVVALKVGDLTHRYYVDETGRLEYEIVLAKRPAINVITLEMDFPDGLAFWHQPSLTQEKIDRGYRRAENVVGSYAVYWNQKNNKYQTGKFCHIYRPKVIAADEKWCWGELHIEQKILTITVDAAWLDKVPYPVTIDPSIGWDTKGSSNIGSTVMSLGETGTSDGTGGVTTYFNIYIESVGTPSGLKIACSAANASTGNPSGLTVIDQIVGDANNKDGEGKLTVAANGGAIAASTKYYVGWLAQHDDTDGYYDTSVGVASFINYNDLVYADEFASPMTAGYVTDADRYSVWLDYAPAGPGGLSIPVAMHHYQQMRQ